MGTLYEAEIFKNLKLFQNKMIIKNHMLTICFQLKLYLPVQFSWSVMSDSLQPHGLQHARLPCPSPTPGAYSDSHPLSR